MQPESRSYFSVLRSPVSAVTPFHRGKTIAKSANFAKNGNCFEECSSRRLRASEQRRRIFFGNGKCELIANFSATMMTIYEGRDGKCEGRNKKCKFLARESVNSSPIVRTFGKGKWKLTANFSATMMTSLPSLSLCISLSLSPSAPHAQDRKRFRASYNK